MNEQHLNQVDALIRQTRGVLDALRAGRAPDLDQVSERRARILRELQSLEPARPDAPDAEKLSERLTLLAHLNDEMIEMTRVLLEETSRRLTHTHAGRRGLAGYHRAAAGGRMRRIPRGIG